MNKHAEAIWFIDSCLILKVTGRKIGWIAQVLLKNKNHTAYRFELPVSTDG